MKKSFLIWGMALCLFAGCTEDEVVSENALSKNCIQATIEATDPQSRLAVNDDNSLSWMQGDAFEMFSPSGVSETWTLTNVVDGLGYFEGNMPELAENETTCYVFYPSSEENKPTFYKSGYSCYAEMTIPHELTYSENATCNIPMYASVYTPNFGNQPIEFKYLTSMLKVQVNDIPEGFHTMTVTADKPLAGKFGMPLNGGTIQFLDDQANEKKEVKVSFEAIAGDNDNDRVFYLPLIPNTYGFLKVSVSNGQQEIVLKEWTNRSIQSRKVYWASLVTKSSDAQTPTEVSAELQSLTAENPTVSVTLTERVVADEEAVEVPVVEGAASIASLVFDQTPVTSEQTPLNIVEKESATAPEAEVSNAIELSFPNDASDPVYLNMETPQNTVTITDGYIAKLVIASAPNTIVVGDGVTIEELVVKAGNVVIQAGGQVTESITRHADNVDAQTNVTLEDGATLSDDVTLGTGVRKLGGTLEADKTWYDASATEFEIDTPQELYGFMQLLYEGNTFAGMTVKMAADIDMLGYTIESPGMVWVSGQYTAFQGIFDGQGHSIQNLNMTYVLSASNNRWNRETVIWGLIPYAKNATIQNVTMEGGKMYTPLLTSDGDFFYMGSLVGYAQATNVINCHNVGCEVVSDNRAYIGGIIGYYKYVEEVGCNIIACTNSGTVKSTDTSDYTSCIAGIAGAGWGGKSNIVACYNTGTMIGATSDIGQAGGISGDHGGYNYLYGSFNNGQVIGMRDIGSLLGGASYSGYYYYSCYTGEKFAGYDWSGESNRTEIHQVSSYAQAVDILNAGIDYYNNLETTTVRCEYRFVAGSEPQLAKQ